MALARGLFLQFLFTFRTFAVIVIPLTLHYPKPFQNFTKPASSSVDILSRIIPSLDASPDFQYAGSIYAGANETFGVYPSQDSFVRGIMDAGVQHQHLEISPENVWLTILTQMNFYLNKHRADKEVRSKFDNPKEMGTWQTHQFGMMTQPQMAMDVEIWRRNKTEWLQDWIHPDFSTSNIFDDGMMADVLMLAVPEPVSFDKIAPITCGFGIPSITLLGTQADWERLLLKLDRLEEFGAETTQYSHNLRPILSRFVTTFKDPDSQNTRQFWTNIVTTPGVQCNTTSMVRGWINGFHYWDAAGNLLSQSAPTDVVSGPFSLDNVTYVRRHINDLPAAIARLQVCLGADAPGAVDSELVAGMLGKLVRRDIPQDYAAAMRRANFTLSPTASVGDHSILRPATAWTLHGQLKVSNCDKNALLWPHE